MSMIKVIMLTYKDDDCAFHSSGFLNCFAIFHSAKAAQTKKHNSIGFNHVFTSILLTFYD